MALNNKKKKKKDVLEDEFGSKDLPFRTNSRAMRDDGVKPIRKKSKKVEDMSQWIIRFFTIVLTLFLLFSLISALTANGRINGINDKMKTMSSPAFKAKYDSLGKTIIESYYAGDNIPTNLLSTVTWLSGTNASQGASSNGGIQGNSQYNSSSNGSSSSGKTVKVDVKSLSLVDAYETDINVDTLEKDIKPLMVNPKVEVLTYTGVIDSKQYKFGLSLLIPDINSTENLPYLMYAPSILPMNTLTSITADISKPVAGSDSDYTEFQATQPILEALDSWASAYAQDDKETLKRLTGDPDPTRQYNGIGGFTLQGTPSVLWSYAFTPGGKESDIAIMRVNFNMQTTVSTGREENDSLNGRNSSNEFIPTQTMDIMIHGYSKGTPNIVAWTQAGNWEKLNSNLNVTIINPESQDTQNENSLNNIEASTTNTTTTSGSANVADVPTLTKNTTKNSSSSSSSKSKSTKTSTKSSGKTSSNKQ